MASQKQNRSWNLGIDLGMTLAYVALVLLISAASQLQAQTLTVLHSFTSGKDGANPVAGLTMDAAGNLYGTSQNGGAGNGTVFKLGHAGSGWTLTPLYTFGGDSDGAHPVARVVFGPNHTLYGTTKNGGTTGDCTGGCGTVFNLQPQPNACTTAICPWVETILQRFTTLAFPESEVVFDSAGNLYGTAYSGGTGGVGGGNGCWPSCGAVYELSPLNGSWVMSVLHNFSGYQYGDDGANPVGGLTFDSAGNLYGTAFTYGDCDYGIAFQLTPSGSEHLLHDSCGEAGNPAASMIADAAGNFYGTMLGNGSAEKGGVFTLKPSGGGWMWESVYTFPWNGGGSAGALLIDSAGNLYGTTVAGGGNPLGKCPSNGCGTIFQLTPSGSGFSYTQLYAFTGGSDGSAPYSNLVQDTDGNFYGTASTGGADGYGVIFKFTP